jgi:hypothetical protein
MAHTAAADLVPSPQSGGVMSKVINAEISQNCYFHNFYITLPYFIRMVFDFLFAILERYEISEL